MSKKLTPLEALEKLTNYKCSCMSEKIECKNIIEIALKDYEQRLELAKEYKDVNNVAKRLLALEIIKNITKHTSHFRLKERQNLGEDEMSYYLVIGYGMSECEYKLKNKDEYDLLKEVLL